MSSNITTVILLQKSFKLNIHTLLFKLEVGSKYAVLHSLEKWKKCHTRQGRTSNCFLW